MTKLGLKFALMYGALLVPRLAPKKGFSPAENSLALAVLRSSVGSITTVATTIELQRWRRGLPPIGVRFCHDSSVPSHLYPCARALGVWFHTFSLLWCE